ncbi:copper amine oxidase N-terminal domain-containing protein [Paenibacillus sp. DMB20]|uniref:copper amine oxidase N-terminal domain-containing protein n=1 Tax=Paenibacillus sp. DMB20 TaxID=1642570 RepID=UPI000627E42E|nr:copper amine oxidase N-terminal domain-containing protein [Paenibacillus sp. DMB20]KKO52466.1 copper amine oxidase [Paenibacillus sp. DMB20]
MKKTAIFIASLALVLCTTAGAVSAKPGDMPAAAAEKAKPEKEPRAEEAQNKEDKAEKEDKGVKEDKEVKEVKIEDKSVEDSKSLKTESQETDSGEPSEPSEPTESKNKGPQGYKGLLHAIENVKDKPAGAVLADILLSKYEAQLTDEQKKELQAIVEKDKALEAAAKMLEDKGNVTDAVYVQEEAIKANFKNLDLYKTMDKLQAKAGKNNGIKLYVNGEAQDAEPLLKKGNTFVPFRAIAESLKAEVTWNPEERSIIVKKDGVTLKLVVNSKTATVDGKKVPLDAPVTVTKGSTYVPVRFISEALDATVKWEPESQTVVVYEEEQK